MKTVWAVYFGMHYEGEDVVALFYDKETAEDFRVSYTAKHYPTMRSDTYLEVRELTIFDDAKRALEEV